MREQIEELMDEIDDTLTRSHMTEEAYDYLYNVQCKLYDILFSNGEGLEHLPTLMSLEKY